MFCKKQWCSSIPIKSVPALPLEDGRQERGRKGGGEVGRGGERLTEERKHTSLVQNEEDLAIFPEPPFLHTEVAEVSLL